MMENIVVNEMCTLGKVTEFLVSSRTFRFFDIWKNWKNCSATLRFVYDLNAFFRYVFQRMGVMARLDEGDWPPPDHSQNLDFL